MDDDTCRAGRRARWWAAVPRVLREEPAYRLLFGSQLLSVVGDRMTALAMPFAVLGIGGDVRDVAAVSAAQFLPFVVLVLPAGVWADRFDRRRILIHSDLARLLTQVTAAVLLLTGHASVAVLVVLAAVFGAADSLFTPAYSALLPQTVRPRLLQEASALRGATLSLANVLGPLAAGGLIAVGGAGPALAVDAATFAVSIALLIPLRVAVGAAGPTAISAERFTAALGAGWAAVRSRSWVWGFLVGLSVYHAIVLPAVYVVGPVLMAEEYAGARSWGVVVAAFGVGGLIGNVLLMWWRPARALKVASVLMVAASLQAVVIGSGLPLPAVAALELVAGVCVTGMFTLWETSLGEHVPATVLARVSSLDHLVTTGLLPLGSLLVSGVVSVSGIRPTLAALSVVGVAVSLCVGCLPSVRALPRTAEDRRKADARSALQAGSVPTQESL